MVNKNFYQYFPPIFGIICVMVVFGIFPNPNNELKLTNEEIFNCPTYQAITNYPFVYSVLISTGILIPFIINFLFAFFFSRAARRMDIYLLLCLVAIIQGFNVYFIHESRKENNLQYFWNYFMGQYCQMVAICCAVYSLQMYVAKHASTMMILLSISTVLYNISMVAKISSAMTNVALYELAFYILFSCAILCNIGVIYLWIQKLLYSLRCGLQTFQQEFFSLCEICILSLYMVMFFIMNGLNFTKLRDNNVIAVNILAIVAFYGIVQIYFLRLKFIADSSEEALETKRAFVRYVSHEIRTPLNTACIGLNLLDQEIHRRFPALSSPATDGLNSLENDLNPPSSSKESLSELVVEITQACNTAVDILSDLLLYEKIDGGLMVIEAQEVSLSPFVQDSLTLFSLQAKASNIEIVFQNQLDSNVFVSIDSDKMIKVLRNLVSNALKFSKGGSTVIVNIETIDNSSTSTQQPIFTTSSPAGTPRNNRAIVPSDDGNTDLMDQQISHASSNSTCGNTTSCCASPCNWISKRIYPSAVGKFAFQYGLSIHNSIHMVRISVQDFGAGISRENQQKLFNDVVQFDAAKLQNGKGSGIGLWISNKIMKLHGGKINVHSEGEGCGCTFSIDLPVVRMQLLRGDARHSRTVFAGRENAPNNNNNNPEEGLFSALANRSSHMIPIPGRIRTTGEGIDLDIENRVGGQHDTAPPTLHSVTGSTSNHVTPTASSIASQSVAATPSHITFEHESVYSRKSNTSNRSPTAAWTPTGRSPTGSSQRNLLLIPIPAAQRVRVIVIDDSEVTRKMVRRQLRDFCTVCDEAEDGWEGVEKVRLAREQESDSNGLLPSECNGYDVVITDYHMPRMNGIEVVEYLRSNGYGGKIIGLTGNAESSMAEAFQDAGADKLLVKPVKGRELYELFLGFTSNSHLITEPILE